MEPLGPFPAITTRLATSPDTDDGSSSVIVGSLEYAGGVTVAVSGERPLGADAPAV
jgi:hypothetical protein